MDDEPMVRHWKHVERWLRDEAAACLERGDLPRTALVAFRRRRTALVVEGPVFCKASADAITDVLCSVIHEVGPDQLLCTVAGRHDPPGTTDVTFTLRGLLLERGRPARHLVHPLLFDTPGAPIVAIASQADDRWTHRLRRTFDHPEEQAEIIATEPPCVDDFLIAVPPDAPLTDNADIPA